MLSFTRLRFVASRYTAGASTLVSRLQAEVRPVPFARVNSLQCSHNHNGSKSDQALPHARASWHSESNKRHLVSQLLIPTLKENPADAVTPSHRLMIRAGYIRPISSGFYMLLPLGVRTLDKVVRVIDEELQAIGCQKLDMPYMLPSSLWKQSGRWDTAGPELFRLQDRKDAQFCLGPTHEEPFTALVAQECSSYKQLPLKLYQIGRKYRDEIRPRYGLLRAREFVMKDLYSFHASQSDALATYEQVKLAYHAIFKRLGLPVHCVEADSGSIGGNYSHEFHVPSEVGEDVLLHCSQCDYAANLEKAVSQPAQRTANAMLLDDASYHRDVRFSAHLSTAPAQSLALCQFVQDVMNHTGLLADLQQQTACNVATWSSVDGVEHTALILTPLHDAVNEVAVKALVRSAHDVEPLSSNAAADHLWQLMQSGNLTNITAVVDSCLSVQSPSANNDAASGNHKPLAALSVAYGQVRGARAGDTCLKCLSGTHSLPLASTSSSKSVSGTLQALKGIEIGHVFYLGTKYSEPMKALFKNEHGVSSAMEMGCYGIGVSRVIAAAIEAAGGHDKDGIVWTEAMAPFRMIIVPLMQHAAVSTSVAASSSATVISPALQAAEQLYDLMQAEDQYRGEVVLDDRALSPAVKLKDASLLGVPWIAVFGKAYDKDRLVELQHRSTGKKTLLPLTDVPAYVHSVVRAK